jgi:signal transduction histidine kinase
MTGPRSQGILTKLGSLPATMTKSVWPLPAVPAPDPAAAAGALYEQEAALGKERRRRHVLLARLAAVFYLGSGALGLVTIPLPAPGSNRIATVAISAAALAIGMAIWLAPWGTWPRRATLGIIPPALALIALANTFGGSDLHTYGIFFVVVFVWIGLAQPPGTSLIMAPLAAAAYVFPLLALPGSVAAGLSSAAVTIPVCVLVGEGIAVGMTRLEEIEQALHRERFRSEQLRELDDMKDSFLSTVSHELRTPITICRGHLEVLEAGAGGTEVQAVKKMLVSELALMGRLVEDLTTLARAGDRVVIKVESLGLDDFMDGIVTMAEPILGDRLVSEPGPTGATLRADPQRLTQALLNLLQNAARHARGAGPVRLRVREERADWRFEVADEGGGLSPGAEQFIFQPFHIGSSATGRTGLGLSIVRGIARAHRGDCGVVNRPGQGATFWIRIPR